MNMNFAKRSAALLLLALAVPAFGQGIPLEIKGGDAVTVKIDKVIVTKVDLLVIQSFPFTINAEKGHTLYFWTYPAGVVALDKGEQLEVTSAPKGPLAISVKSISVDFEKKALVTKFGSIAFNVGVVPPPTPPVPPVPPDPPKPDPPKPDPAIPAPIPLAGFRVLFVEESADRAKLTLGQFNAMFGKTSRDWLDANTTRENGQPGYRIYDKDALATSDVQQWPKDALKRPRQSVPWIIISNGVTGYEGPLPVLEMEIKALLQKYVPTGGNR